MVSTLSEDEDRRILGVCVMCGRTMYVGYHPYRSAENVETGRKGIAHRWCPQVVEAR